MSLRWSRPVTQGALLLMESLWVYALVAFLVALVAEGGKPTLFGATAVVVVSFAMSRFLQQTDLDLGLLRAWGMLLSLLLFYAIVRVDFFGDWRFWDFGWADRLFSHTTATLKGSGGPAALGVPVLWAFWLRGVSRGQQDLGFEGVIGSFAIGVVIVAFVELLAGSVDAPAAVRQVAIPYVAVGLLAIGLAHAARAEPEFGRSFTPTWLFGVGGAVVLIGAFALIFVLVDLATATSAMASAGEALGEVWAKAVYYMLWPFVMAMDLLAQGVRWFFENVWGGERQERPEPAEQAPPQPLPDKETHLLPGWAMAIARVLLGGVAVAVIVLASALFFTRFRRRARPGEVKESTYQEGRLTADLGDLIGSLLGRLRPAFHLGGAQLDPVRRLYFDLLSAAAQRGIQRRPPETPLELSPRLSETFASDTPARITALFDDVRYGGLSPPEADVQRLRDEWESTRQPT